MNSNKYSHSDLVVDWAEVLHWWTKRHCLLATTGQEPKRHRRMEITLRRLAQRKKLRAIYYGKKLVYALPRKTKNFDIEDTLRIYHGLSSSEMLVRFYLSQIDCEIIPERFFRGLGSVPEWGIRYPNDTMLLGEFCTRSNTMYHENVRGKLNAYDRNLEKIENEFGAQALVVFVLDVPREKVKRLIEKWRPFGPYYFTDFKTLLSIPVESRSQLTAPIYYWTDGKEYPLKK